MSEMRSEGRSLGSSRREAGVVSLLHLLLSVETALKPLICGICRQPIELVNFVNHQCQPTPKKITRREFFQKLFKR